MILFRRLERTLDGAPLSGEEFTFRLSDIKENRLSEQYFCVSEIAREMRFSRSTLYRRVKEAFNCSANR
jgi:AraC-like DNA-binding protein